MRRNVLYISPLLAWADAHRKRTGEWPNGKLGRVYGVPDEKWINIDQALIKGLRGFPGGSSLAQLLSEYRGHRNRKRLPKLTVKQILSWADGYYKRIGKWPTPHSGTIIETRGETWMAVEMALGKGQRGLPGGSSLARLLAKYRNKRNCGNLPPLTRRQVLRWANKHRRRTGKWPNLCSGPVVEAPAETWSGVDVALKQGHRSLPGGESLYRLLGKYRRSANSNSAQRRKA